MGKYNVGDKVRVRNNLKELGGVGTMLDFAGKVVTISKVNPTAFFGIEIPDVYNIKEDATPYKFLWSDFMFDSLVESGSMEEPVDPVEMPKLTTGMFGIEFDGECFVVVNDNCVYEGGLCEGVRFMNSHPEKIKALYKSDCFKQIKDNRAELIWKNPN